MARTPPQGRRSRGGAGRHAQQYKVTAESVLKKLAVLDHLAVSQKMRSTIAHFYPNLATAGYNSKRTTIHRWARQRDSLEAAAADGKGGHLKVRSTGVATILPAENEAEIAQWVDELRGNGISVSTQMLTDKALDIADEAGIEDFKASDKWVAGFKGHHRFSLRYPTRQSQITPTKLS
jgi:hypothetical protein